MRHHGQKKRAARCQAAHSRRDRLGQFIAPATLLITFDTLLPTVVNAVIAATAIREAISVYSMAVAPCSFFIRRRKMDSIGISTAKRTFFDGRSCPPLMGSGDR